MSGYYRKRFFVPTVDSIDPTSPTIEANTIESYFSNHPFFEAPCTNLMRATQGSAVEYMNDPSIQAVMWFFCSLGMFGLWPVLVSYWALRGRRIRLF